MNDYDKDQDYSRRTSDEAKKYQLEADGGEGGHGEPIANYELHHQTKNESDAASSEFELEQEAGVSRIEALYTVFGYGWKLWALYIALGLFCYANSLEGNTTYNYQQFAVSSFGAHPLLSTIGILTSIMGGVIKPFVSKIADLFSRPSALAGSVILLAIGMMVTAVSKDVHTVAAGSVLSTMGGTGVDVVFTILLGDLSPLKWRGFMQGLSSMPYVVNFAISPKIVAALKVNTGNDNWRWGYGMFSIIIPACAAPILFVLYWADHRAKKAGTVSVAASDLRFKQQIQGKNATETVWSWMVFYWRRIDGFGLILLGFAFSLILLPFSLAAGADHGYKNRSLIAMFVVGGVTMIAFFTWEWRYAKFPLMPKRVMNRTMVCCCIIDFLYYFSGYLPNYFTSWIFVVKDWSFVNYNYWTQCLGVALCFFGLCAGIVMRYTKRYKWTLMFGLCARAIGMGLQFLAANGNKSDAVLVISQIFVGIGGGCSVVGTQVAVQAAVPHRDMGTAIALLALWTSVGGAIGNAIAGALWTHELPKRLQMYAGDVLNSTQLAEIAGSTPIAHVAEPRAAIIRAYDEASWLPLLLALVFTIVAIPVGFWCQEFELGDAQNAVEEDKVIRVKKQAEVDAELEGRA